jgi:hypothetical protein
MGPCMCGDPYCGSCGPAQGYHKCEHRRIYGDCTVEGCVNYQEEELDSEEDIEEAIWTRSNPNVKRDY